MKLRIGIHNLQKSYLHAGHRAPVYTGMSQEFLPSEIYCLFGPSGYGKSTLLNIIAGTTEPDSGYVTYTDDSRGKQVSRREITIGYVFQHALLFPWLTVYDNLKLVLEGTVPESAIPGRIEKYLGLFAITGAARKYPGELSGGQQQRVSIIRALIVDPDVLLLDEAFSHLDESIALDVRRLILAEVNRKKILTIFVTHNLIEAASVASRVLLIGRKQGKTLRSVILPRVAIHKQTSELAIYPTVQRNIKKILAAGARDRQRKR